MEVRPLGRLTPVDADGYIVSDVDRAYIRPPWDAPLDEVVRACVEHWGDALHSVYVRGSLPRGFAVEGVSDIDCYALVRGRQGEIDTSWIEAVCHDLDAKYPFQTGIEIIAFSLEGTVDPGDSPLFRIVQFSIGTNCLCIHGEDLGPSLPRVKPGPGIAVRAANLPSEMQLALSHLGPESPASEVREWCAWIMKRVVRTGFELVMEREQAYTRDFYFCFEAFARHHPEYERAMYRCLELAVAPSEDSDEVRGILLGFGTWVRNKGAEYVGLGPA
jgi:hypothetical protein